MEMLVSLSALAKAMEIAIYLMGQASPEMEYTDEGMMLEEAAKCLQPIFEAFGNHDETQRSSWAVRMQVVSVSA